MLCGIIYSSLQPRPSAAYPTGSRFAAQLLSVEVHYRIVDVQLHASVKQTYICCASEEAEVNYSFPLPPDASVCFFEATFDQKNKITGVVKTKDQALADYRDAIQKGHAAALLEQVNEEVFQVSLGNVVPAQMIEVHIAFVSVVTSDAGQDSIRLTFPVTIAPRYGVPPSDLKSSNVIRRGLHLTAAVEMTSTIKSIGSSSHPIVAKLGTTLNSEDNVFVLDDTKAHISLFSESFLDKDIIISVTCDNLDQPRCFAEHNEEDGTRTDAYALTLVPAVHLPPQPSQEYIFLVDRSGSMEGKMVALCAALQIMLKSLPTNDTTFNIISFGSLHEALWRSSKTYTAASVKEASSHVDKMTASFGGTEINSAVQAALGMRKSFVRGNPKATAIFVLTDGQSWDVDGVKATIRTAVAEDKKQNGILRVFALGIGDGVSKAMCEGMARAGDGSAVYVGEREKPDQQLMKLLRAARATAIQDISIDWGVADTQSSDVHEFKSYPIADPKSSKEDAETSSAYLEQPSETLLSHSKAAEQSKETELGLKESNLRLPLPSRIRQVPSSDSFPPIYPGFRTNAFAIVTHEPGMAVLSKSVRVTGRVLGQPVLLDVPVIPVLEGHNNSKLLHTLAARALIRSIEEKTPISSIERTEVTDLAVKYSLASPQTSFVAVDDEGKQFRVGLPREMDERQHLRTAAMIGDSPFVCLGFVGSSAPASQIPIYKSSKARRRAKKGSRVLLILLALPIIPFFLLYDKVQVSYKRKKAAEQRAPSALAVSMKSASQDTEPSVGSLALVQSFDGSFNGSPDLYDMILKQRKMPKLPPSLVSTLGTDERANTVWCTLLCVAYLECKFHDEQDIWAPMVEKARGYVETVLLGSSSARNTGDSARQVSDLKGEALGLVKGAHGIIINV